MFEISPSADRHCPGCGRTIDAGLCWEFAFAERGGPADAAADLRRWLQETGKFASIAQFQAVCETCPHRPWDAPG